MNLKQFSNFILKLDLFSIESGPCGEEVLHGADVVDGHVQDVDLGQLLALAASGEHRVRDLRVRSAMRLSVGGVKLNQIQEIYTYTGWISSSDSRGLAPCLWVLQPLPHFACANRKLADNHGKMMDHKSQPNPTIQGDEPPCIKSDWPQYFPLFLLVRHA